MCNLHIHSSHNVLKDDTSRVTSLEIRDQNMWPYTRSSSVDLDFLENFNFHVLMYLKVYKHVFTQVRLCTGKKITLTIYT